MTDRKIWTDTLVLRIRPPADAGSEATVWHPAIHRFGIRFRRSRTGTWGTGTYTVIYHQGGRDRPISIGKVGGITLPAAVAEAQKVSTAAAQKLDPRAERDRADAAHTHIFKASVPGYIADLGMQGLDERYIATTERYLTRYFPDLRELPLRHIELSHCADALRRLLKPGPDWRGGKAVYVQAGAALSAYFEWLLGEGRVSVNPVHGIKRKRYLNEPRDRTLTEIELRLVWNAIDTALIPGTACLFKLLVLTGCRRNEIGNLRKAAVDLGEVPVIRLAAEDTKNGKPFLIPLSRQAVTLLRAQLQDAGNGTQYVFGRDGAAGGFQGFEKAMVALCKQIGDAVPHWTLHDLRRTFVTLGFDCLQLDPSVLDACLSHTPNFQKGVAGTYQRAQLLKQRAQVMQAWADYCDTLTAPAGPHLRLVAA